MTDYVDQAAWSDEWIVLRQEKQGRADWKEKRAKGGAKKKFTSQLYCMLEAVDGTVHSLTVRWLPHGRAFAVLDKARFVQEVLPRYFPGQKEYKSFQRQLNIYGFLRLTRQDDAYYHECFLRARFLLASSIPRPVFARNATRRSFDPASEHNLYVMTWLPDIVRLFDGATSPDIERTPPSRLGHSLVPSSQMPRPDRNVAVYTMIAPKWAGYKRSFAEVYETVDVEPTANLPLDGGTSEQEATSLSKRNREDPLPTFCVASTSTSHLLHKNKQVALQAVLASFPANREGRFQYASAGAPPACEINRDCTSDPGCDNNLAKRVVEVSREQCNVISSTSTVARDESDMETICPETSSETRAAKLQDWVDFFYDVDLDASDDEM